MNVSTDGIEGEHEGAQGIYGDSWPQKFNCSLESESVYVIRAQKCRSFTRSKMAPLEDPGAQIMKKTTKCSPLHHSYAKKSVEQIRKMLQPNSPSTAF